MALRKGAGVVLAGLGAATTFQYQRIITRERNLPQQALAVFDKRQSATIDPSSSNDKQRVIVIGAGVVGVSTAYKLAKLGHQVVILVRKILPSSKEVLCEIWTKNCTTGILISSSSMI